MKQLRKRTLILRGISKYFQKETPVFNIVHLALRNFNVPIHLMSPYYTYLLSCKTESSLIHALSLLESRFISLYKMLPCTKVNKKTAQKLWKMSHADLEWTNIFFVGGTCKKYELTWAAMVCHVPNEKHLLEKFYHVPPHRAALIIQNITGWPDLFFKVTQSFKCLCNEDTYYQNNGNLTQQIIKSIEVEMFDIIFNKEFRLRIDALCEFHDRQEELCDRQIPPYDVEREKKVRISLSKTKFDGEPTLKRWRATEEYITFNEYIDTRQTLLIKCMTSHERTKRRKSKMNDIAVKLATTMMKKHHVHVVRRALDEYFQKFETCSIMELERLGYEWLSTDECNSIKEIADKETSWECECGNLISYDAIDLMCMSCCQKKTIIST